MLRRILKQYRGREPRSGGSGPQADTADISEATLPIFPTRDEMVERAFTAQHMRTAHGTILASPQTGSTLVHDYDPHQERRVILFRSTAMPQIGVLAATCDLDLYGGSLVGPLLPVLLIDQPGSGRIALRSPIRDGHLCALQPEGNPASGTTDFHRNWIGPWELFSSEPVQRPILGKPTEAALAHIGRLLESGMDPAFITAWMADAAKTSDQLPRTLAGQVLVHVMARAQIVASAVHWQDDHQNHVRARAQPPSALCAPVAGPLHDVDEIRPQPDSGPDTRLRGGWSTNEQGSCAAAGSRVIAEFSLPCRPTHARLLLDIQASHHPILMTVSVNGWCVGRTALGLRKVHGSRLEYWIPKNAMTSTDLSITFDFDPPPPANHQFPYAFELRSCALQAGSAAIQTAVIENPTELMALFESLGEDCEFGFVQRHFGIEPMGIFRFGGFVHLYNVVKVLESDLEGLGSPGSLTAHEYTAHIHRDPEPPLLLPEYYMTDQRLQFSFHTWKDPRDINREDAIRENEQKLSYLRRKLIEDLEDAEKIWLFKDTRREDANEVYAIYDLLNRHGPNKLFWVTRAIEGRPCGSVEWIGPRLLRGYSNQPHIDAQRFVPDTWVRLCRNAQCAFSERN